MKRQALTIAILALAAAEAHAGAIYKCVVDGQTTYSQYPCAPDAEVIRAPVAQAASSATTAASSGYYSRLSEENEKPRWVEVDMTISGDLQAACLDRWRPALLDPRGAYVVSSRARRPLGDLDAVQILIDASVTTAIGGKKRIDFICPLTADGAISEKDVALLRTAYQAGLYNPDR